MIPLEVVASVLLFLTAGGEHVLAVRANNRWWKIAPVVIPVLALFHALSWVYTKPLQQAKGIMQSLLINYSTLVLLTLVFIFVLLPLLASRYSQSRWVKLETRVQAMPSLAFIFAIYLGVVRHYSWFLDKNNWQILGIVALLLSLLALLGFFLYTLNESARKSLRPFLLLLCWIFFEL